MTTDIHNKQDFLRNDLRDAHLEGRYLNENIWSVKSISFSANH